MKKTACTKHKKLLVLNMKKTACTKHTKNCSF